MAAILVSNISPHTGTAAERAAMSTTGLKAGSTFEETDTGLLYKWSGAAWFVSGSVTKSDALAPSATFTRPNDTTAYLAGDVVGAAVTANITFSNVVATAAALILIADVLFRIDIAAVPSGMTNFKLHLFNAAPTAIADNAAWALADADRAKYLGFILLDAPTDMGGTLWSHTQSTKTFKLAAASTTLYGQVETVPAFTPSASDVFTLNMNAMTV